MAALEDAVERDPRRRPARRGDADGAADLGRPARRRSPRSSTATRRWRSAAARPSGPGYWFAPTVLCPVDPEARAAREEIFGPVATVIPFDDEEDAVAARQRHDLRALGLDLDPRRRARAARRAGDRRPACCRSTRTPRCASRRRSAASSSRLRPRARPARARRLHRGQVDLLRDRHERAGASSGKVCVITGAAGGIGAASAELFAREGARVVGVDLRRALGRRARAAGRPRRRAGGPRPVRARARGARAESTCCSTTPASPRPTTRRCSTPRSRPGSGCRTSNLRSVFLCCKHGIPHLLDGRRRLGDQHRVVRRGARRGDLADLLHRVEGRRARAVARAGRRVRAPRRARQRALPRAGRHAAAPGALRRRIPSRPRGGSCTSRWAGSRGPRRSPTPRCSSPATSRATSTRRRSWSTAGITGAYTTPL